MEKKLANFKSCLQPAPKVLVSCRYNQEDNALAVAYCCNCSFDPPMLMVGIVPSRYSYAMVKKSGVFVVNLPGKQSAELFDFLGKNSRRDMDKLALSGVRIREAEKINAPILDDCPINIECQVVDSILTGSHEMFVGKIVHVHAESSLVDESGAIDFKSANLL